MEHRLSQTQLAQVIAEVERLSQQRTAELDRQQVKEILQELNLPDDLLDDALLQLQRREALANRHKRNWLIAAGVVVALVAAIATTTISSQRQQQAMARTAIVASRVSVGQNSSHAASIDPTNNPQVFYHVTLKDAPVGSRLSLSCDWIDPRGQIVHQSRYQTKAIDRQVWNTYCYHSLSHNAATGTWEVRMMLAERSLGSQRFVVGKP